MTKSARSSSTSISVVILNFIVLDVAATMSCRISSKYISEVIVLDSSESVDICEARFSILRYWREFSTAPATWAAMDCSSRT